MEQNMRWLAEALAVTPHEGTIDPQWSWEDFGRWWQSKKADKDLAALIVKQIIGYGSAHIMCLFCLYAEDREDVWRAMAEMREGGVCVMYCEAVKDRPEVWQALIESRNRSACAAYCVCVKYRPSVWRVFMGGLGCQGDEM